MTEDWTKWEGLIIDGVFPLRRYLGRSDHSVVFLTEHGAHNLPDAAIKLIPADPVLAEAQLSRWTIAGALSHPHLIRIFGSGRCWLGGHPFLYVVMEYADQTLAQLLPHRALTPEEARELLLPTLEALAFLHGKNLVQGQLKPPNVLVVDDRVKLASDTVRPAGDSAAGIGEPSLYDAPEVKDGRNSAACDVWGLGVTIVEALTQRPPAWPDARREIVSLPAALPPLFADIARRCLSRYPAGRPSITGLVAQIKRAAHAPGAPVTDAGLSPVQASKPEAGKAAVGAATVSQVRAGEAPVGEAAVSEARVTKAAAEAPVTPAAVAEVAVTKAPVTQPAVAEVAVSKDPTTQPAVAEVAVSKAPATQPAVAEAAVTKAPVTQPAVAEAAVTNAPVSNAAGVGAPMTKAAGSNAAAAETSLTKAAAPKAMAATESPVTKAASAEAPPSKAVATKVGVSAVVGVTTTANETSTRAAAAEPPAAKPLPISAIAAGVLAVLVVIWICWRLFHGHPNPPQPASSNAQSSSQQAAPPAAPTQKLSAPAPTPAVSAVLHQEIPDVPRHARDSIRGRIKVTVRVTVDRSGNVVGQRLVNSGSSRYFARLASVAAGKWKFAPTDKPGSRGWLLQFEFTRGGAAGHAAAAPT
jgi:TonB family protein